MSAGPVHVLRQLVLDQGQRGFVRRSDLRSLNRHYRKQSQQSKPRDA